MKSRIDQVNLDLDQGDPIGGRGELSGTQRSWFNAARSLVASPEPRKHVLSRRRLNHPQLDDDAPLEMHDDLNDPITDPPTDQQIADEVEAEAAAQAAEMEIIDWVFKCATITLLSLILLCCLVTLIKVWNITPVLADDTVARGSVHSMHRGSGGLYGSSNGLDVPRYNPTTGNTSGEDPVSRVGGAVTGRLLGMLTSSTVGKASTRLLSVLLSVVRSCATIVFAPLRFVFTKLITLAYICAFVLFALFIVYWVFHAFLAQTLGDWFINRLNLPAPKQLVSDFLVFVGYAFFNRWWSLTELLKEKVLVYFNSVVLEDRLRGNGGTMGLGGTPGPLARRNTGIWGTRPLGYRQSVVSHRNSVHYPRSTIYNGIQNIDSKRRLQTIAETTTSGLGYRAGQGHQSTNAVQNRGLGGLFGSNANYGNPQTEVSAPAAFTSRIHNSPVLGGVSYEENRPDYFTEFQEKENSQLNARLGGNYFNKTFGNQTNQTMRQENFDTLNNPLVTNSPVRPVRSTNNYPSHLAERNRQRQAKIGVNDINPSRPGVNNFRGKRGGMAFNI